MFGVSNICTMTGLRFIWESMVRKKPQVFSEKTELNRVMSIFDLVFLGIGTMLGMGVYIMSGSLAKTVGPAMVLSFILAGVAALLSALCYAEFAGRAPGTGSAYAYCYITVGEFMAFILGWNLALEFVIGTACLARGLSAYLDSIFEGSISKYMTKTMGMNMEFLSPYPDFLAFVIMIAYSVLVASGVKNSTKVNNTFVVINMVTLVILILFGASKADPANWSLRKEDLPASAGEGGFLPYGFSSIIEGAATAFYAYTGFDTVATTGAEAKNPHRAIPVALIVSMTIAMVVYTSISATYTLMWPYYDQVSSAPYPHILQELGWPILKYVVTCGAISAILGCVIGSIFGMARIVYSISADGLLYEPLAKVNKITKTPVTATVVSGVLTGLIAVIFDTDQLISMTSIGTLMAYTMVGVCVLVLRYEPSECLGDSKLFQNKSGKRRNLVEKIFNIPYIPKPDKDTALIARAATYMLCLFAFLLCSIFAFLTKELEACEKLPLAAAGVFSTLFLLTMLIIARQPSYTENLKFKVKPVPLLPGISIFINVYLMLKLDKWTWVRFAIWLVIGLGIYFGYGIWHSKERKVQKAASGKEAIPTR